MLRPDRRWGMFALYAFARILDDWSDDPSQNLSAISGENWHRWLKEIRIDAPSTDIDHATACRLDSIRLALADTLERFAIPHHLLHELIDGVSLDSRKPFVIQDRAQLENYCYHVASTVGLACLCIWGRSQSEHESSAIDCGIAFQLTNILRDVREDAVRERVYIPGDLLRNHQVDIDRWLAGEPVGDWHVALQTVIEWARQAYDRGWQVRSELDADGKRMFSLMWHTYRRLLEKIADDLDTVWVRRIALTRWEKTGLFLRHAITPWYQRQSRSVKDDA